MLRLSLAAYRLKYSQGQGEKEHRFRINATSPSRPRPAGQKVSRTMRAAERQAGSPRLQRAASSHTSEATLACEQFPFSSVYEPWVCLSC